MSEISAEQFTEWRAYFDVLGLDEGWRQSAAVCQQIHMLGWAAGVMEKEPGQIKGYIPDLLSFKEAGEETPQPSKYQSPDDMRNAAAARHGF